MTQHAPSDEPWVSTSVWATWTADDADAFDEADPDPWPSFESSSRRSPSPAFASTAAAVSSALSVRSPDDPWADEDAWDEVRAQARAELSPTPGTASEPVPAVAPMPDRASATLPAPVTIIDAPDSTRLVEPGEARLLTGVVPGLLWFGGLSLAARALLSPGAVRVTQGDAAALAVMVVGSLVLLAGLPWLIRSRWLFAASFAAVFALVVVLGSLVRTPLAQIAPEIAFSVAGGLAAAGVLAWWAFVRLHPTVTGVRRP